ncbi:MAG: crossover junction endodeoxyribonuclease RuvC [Planctomycetota bacterium]|jgi:crossover junction endodeoxyribonuclease RuvC
MKILGIDPGLQVCGYAVIQTKFLDTQLMEAGVFRTDGKAALAERLCQIADDIAQVLETHKPDTVSVEQLYAHYKHPRTAILMGHARGVILQKAAESGATVKDYAATRIKKSLTGNGRATKSQMQLSIQSVLGLPQPPEPADVADAIAIALCCANENQFKNL